MSGGGGPPPVPIVDTTSYGTYNRQQRDTGHYPYPYDRRFSPPQQDAWRHPSPGRVTRQGASHASPARRRSSETILLSPDPNTRLLEERSPEDLSLLRGPDGKPYEFPLPNPNRPPQSSHPWTVITIAALFSILTSGIIFGWASMERILEDEGVYACDDSDADSACAEQTGRLNMIFTIASGVFAISVWPSGAFLDTYGPMKSCMLGSVLFAAGCGVFGLSGPGKPLGDLLILGYTLLALGGPPIVFSFMHLSNLVPNRKGSIITLYNVMLDASSLNFVIFQILYEQLNFSREMMFVFYAAVPVLVLITAPILWPNRAYDDEAATAAGRAPPLAHLTYKQQLLSGEFLFALAFTSIQLLRVNFYIGTVDDQMDIILDHTDGEGWNSSKRWAAIFAWALPIGGVVACPAVGWTLDTFSLTSNVFSLWALATLYGGLSCVPNIWVQAGTFVVFAYTRAALFATMSTYVATVFGFKSFGKLWGTIFAFSGIINVGVYFGDKAVESSGSVLVPNLAATVVSAALIVFPLWMSKRATFARLNEN